MLTIYNLTSPGKSIVVLLNVVEKVKLFACIQCASVIVHTTLNRMQSRHFLQKKIAIAVITGSLNLSYQCRPNASGMVVYQLVKAISQHQGEELPGILPIFTFFTVKWLFDVQATYDIRHIYVSTPAERAHLH